MTTQKSERQIFGGNLFKLGLFCTNCNGGMTFSTAPERWKAEWDDIVTVSKIADDAGIEFILVLTGGLGIAFKFHPSISKIETGLLGVGKQRPEKPILRKKPDFTRLILVVGDALHSQVAAIE